MYRIILGINWGPLTRLTVKRAVIGFSLLVRYL